MSYLKLFTGASLLALAACGPNQTDQHLVADIVLTGGTIYTVDGANSVREAMAVKDGKIVFIGSNAEAEAYVGEGTSVTDLQGKAVFPGFTDSHAHLPDGGATILGLGLSGLSSAEEVLAAVKAYADAHPDLPVIFGAGWELSLFPDAHPKKELLDAIVPDRPVFLEAADGHNGWVNSAALEKAGVDASTADPLNGRIERDADGKPTGTLREAAMGLVSPIVPEVSVVDSVANLKAAFAYQNAHGITATIDAAIMNDNKQEAYLELSKRADLPQRVRVSLLAADEMVTSIVTAENAKTTVNTLEERRARFRAASKGRLDAEAVKIFVDGVLENYTGSLLEPYVNVPLGPDHAGETNMSEQALNSYVEALDKADFQVHMHAIGDRAVRVGLNAVEGAINANGRSDHRHHISHLELVQPEDIKRFKPLGVTANMQTLWHYNDAYISDLTEPFLDEKLHRWLYPAKSFVEAGTNIVWGSDWPVSSSNPFQSIEVAVLRKDPDNADDKPWNAVEAITVDDMIHALTINGAYLMGQEDIRGSLEAGKEADFIILDADPYKVTPEDISEIKVQQTFVGGACVHGCK